MNRVDIIGVPGSGKSTFLKKHNFNKIEDEFHLKKKAVIKSIRSKLLINTLPKKFRQPYLESMYREFYKRYQIQDALEDKQNQFFQLLLLDQVFLENHYYTQTLRLNGLVNRLTEVEIWEDYYKDQKDNKITLFDESLLHQLILIYVNLKVSNDHFLNILSHLTPPKGLLVFDNDPGIASQRVINQRISQKSGRPTDNEEFQKLLAESKNYQDLVEVCLEFYKGKIAVQVVDLRDEDAINTAKMKEFIRDFDFG